MSSEAAGLTPPPATTPAKASAGQVVCLTVYVPAALRRAAKVRAAESGTTISALVARAILDHLAGGDAT